MLGVGAVSLSSVTRLSSADAVNSLSASSCIAPLWTVHHPATATELITSSTGHLHTLLCAVAVDHIICIEPGTDCCASGAVPTGNQQTQHTRTLGLHWQELLYAASMVWAFQSNGMSSRPCKASLVTRGRCQVPSWFGTGKVGPRDTKLGGTARGVGMSLFMESRTVYGTCLDLDSPGPHLTASQLQWLLHHSEEYCCVERGGNVFAQRLVGHRGLPRQRRLVAQCNMASTITGGTKGLGRLYALQLTCQGCLALVLTSRSGLLGMADLVYLADAGASASL